MGTSKIEWTDTTWSPVTGCTPIASGCRFCWAKEMHRRLRAMGMEKYQHDWSEVRCHPEELDKPLRWRKPRRVFVNSMSDTFHDKVPFRFIDDMEQVMSDGSWHSYQILTKRPERMLEYLTKHWRNYKPQQHIWRGVSASTQDDLERVVPPLLETPAAVRFLSLEPLLERIDLTRLSDDELGAKWNVLEMGINLVIVGSESGPHRRPYELDWIRSIRDQCVESNTPLFIKQAEIDGKLVKMPEIDGQVWDQMPSASTPSP